MHRFSLHFQCWHRTTRHMSGRQVVWMTARSRWSALRQWWRIQRQLQPLGDVVAIEYHEPAYDGIPWLHGEDERARVRYPTAHEPPPRHAHMCPFPHRRFDHGKDTGDATHAEDRDEYVRDGKTDTRRGLEDGLSTHPMRL